MSREKLIDVADRLTAWFTSDNFDRAALADIVSPDVVLHVPFPALPATFDGLLAHHQRTIKATNDNVVEVKAISVDETSSTVTQFFECHGTQTGYHPLYT